MSPLQKVFLVKKTLQNRKFVMRYFKYLLIPKLYFGIKFLVFGVDSFMKYFQYAFIALILLALASCENPFAPRLENNPTDNSIFGDQRTVEGVFKNFRYAYIFKDTLVYGNLLADDFTFIYYNYEKSSQPIVWGRNDDLIATSNLFNSAKTIDLMWNEVASKFGDSVQIEIRRGFTLTITLPSDIFSVEGKAKLNLIRKKPEDEWKIQKWVDESKN
jgi:hypothetical protein